VTKFVAGIGDAGSAYVGLASVGITDPGYNALHNRPKFAHLIEPNKGVHLRHFLAQFFGESLRHAAAYD